MEAPDRPASATTRIRVVEVRRHLTDPASAGPEELALALAAAREGAALPATRETLARLSSAFLSLAATLQGPLAPLLAEPPAGALAAVTARALLANPAVRLIIAARGPRALAGAEGPALRMRPAARARAIGTDGRDLAVAAEEPVEVVGFAVDPLAAGSAVLAALGSGAYLGADVYAASGAYAAPVLAAVGPVRPPEAPLPAGTPPAWAIARGFASAPAESQGALLRQARAAVGYYLGGAAAAVALAALGAAVRGAPGATPELLGAVGPRHGVLGEYAAERRDGPGPPTWRPPAVEERLRYLLGRLAGEAGAAPEAWAYDANPLGELYRAGALGAYLYALTEGRDSPSLDDFLEQAAIRHAKATQLEALARRASLAAARGRLYAAIVGDKFGAARAAALPAPADDPDAILAALSGREREVVLVEYENRQLEWAASVGNKCPHVRLARRLRAASDAEDALATLQGLARYFVAKRDEKGASPAAGTEWLMCRNCGFRALCPHVRDRVRLEAARAPYDEVRTRLLKYANRGGGDTHTYFCRICSERLAEALGEDRTAELLGRFGDLDAGLRTRIWVVALAAARDVRFPVPTDERQFASAVALVVYPPLMAASAAPDKPGGRGRRRQRAPAAAQADPLGDDLADEIDPRTQVDIAIFVYAHILDLVQTSRGERAGEVGFAGVKPGAKASVYAERMLARISEGYRGALSQLEGVTAEYLASRFAEAYRLVRGEAGGLLQVANPEEELAIQTTTIDPIYRYAVSAARVAGDLPLARAASPAEARREFETILGASLPGLVKLARESAKDPLLAPLFLRRAGVEIPTGGSLEFLAKGPRVNYYARLYELPEGIAGSGASGALASFAARGGAARGQKAPLPPAKAALPPAKVALAPAKVSGPKGPPAKVSGPKGPPAEGFARRAISDPLSLAERGCFFEAYRLFAMYTRDVYSQEALDSYREQLDALRRSERGVLAARAALALRAHYDFGFRATQQHKYVDVPITALYDEQGAAHDWSKRATYYYAASAASAASAAGAAPELVLRGGPAGVKKAIESGELTPGMTLVDVECPVCHTRASRIRDLDAGMAWKALRASFEFDSFFVFYESRCPEGGLHDWEVGTSETPCRKCGLESHILKEIADGRGVTNARAHVYHDKYAARYAQEKREAREVVVAVTSAATALPALIGKERALAWAADYTLVVRAAELAGVTPATIEAIGATEGREYADITEGRGVPPPPTSPADPRAYAADAEVRAFLDSYGALRYLTRTRSPSRLALELTADVPKHELPSLATLLPDVGAGYAETFEAVVRLRPPADARVFAVQSLCRFVLEVAALGGGPSWLAPLGQAFAKNRLQAILRGQRLLSKPGSFNWAIFEADEDDIPDQIGDVGEDVLDDLLGAAGEEAADDPFSGENMDYDTSEANPNNEPA